MNNIIQLLRTVHVLHFLQVEIERLIDWCQMRGKEGALYEGMECGRMD